MKKSAILFLLVLAVSFSGCSVQEDSADRVLVEPVHFAPSAMDEICEVDYLVYFAILEKSTEIQINVARRTQFPRLEVMSGTIREKFARLDPSVIDNFNAKSERPAFFAPITPLERKVTFFDEGSTDELARDAEKDFEHYPYYRFSRIGFSDDDREALVYADYMCAGLCGGGNYYWLRNIDGKWEIIDKLETWVS